MSTFKEHDGDELMQSFIKSLSQPEESLMSLFWPGGDGSTLNSRRHELQLVCQSLFQKIEDLAKAYDSLNKSETPIVLSGLEELYIGTGDQQPVDAETLWGQVELLNEALHPLIKASLKNVIKAVEDQQVCLLDMGDILSDSSGKNDESSYTNEESSRQEEEESSVDEETRRIHARMERVMANVDDSDVSDDEMEQDDSYKMKGKDNDESNAKENADSEPFEDPAAEELNDGFFDIQEMEEFADEEEEYLPEEAFGTVQPEEDSDEQKKSFHQRQREGDIDSGTDEDDDEELTFKATENTMRRRKYRKDDEIEALYSLYSEVRDDDDDDDSVINMTAADFFGQPNKKYYCKWKSISHPSKETKPIDKGIDDADSWDDHDFDANGPGWSDGQSNGKKVTFADDRAEKYDKDDKESGEQNQEENDEPENPSAVSSSSHARHTEKLRRQTEQLEKELLAEKPWHMTGEIKSTSRPVNSLLEGTPEFEVATKMAPLITVEHTANLEEVIKRRILDEDWDDVIPRELPDVAWNMKRGELPEVSQEKSKLGLGELYEREYLKKALGYDVDAAEKETEEEKARNEMKALFANLCSKLDALSNYHFAPRPVAQEAEVRAVTTPAIAMEEVLPLHVSDARGVAPGEVYGSKKGRDGILRGDSELDQAERRRLRGAKKAARRKARKEKLADEKLLSKLQPGLGLNNPYEKRKMREELSMARSKGRVTVGKRDSAADYGASGKFFKRMQEEVEQSVHPDRDSAKKRKRSHDGSSRKSSAFKL